MLTPKERAMWIQLGQPATPEDKPMTTPQQALAEAQAQLNRAQDIERTRQHEELLQQLAAVRHDHREAKARYQVLRRQFYQQQEDRANAQDRINRMLTQITESLACRPEVADLLPADPDVVRWREQHEALERKRDQLIVARDRLPDPELVRREAAGMEGPYGSIATLQYAEQNLLRKLEGRSGVTRLEGGVFGVR